MPIPRLRHRPTVPTEPGSGSPVVSSRARGRTRRWIALTVFGATALVAGCFIETAPPPTFRYECAAESDCEDGFVCDDGLCQIRCSISTFSEDCPSEDGYATCYNGHCTHLCQISEDRCSTPQQCVGLPIDVVDPEPGQGSANDFGFCAQPCKVGECPDGEVCFEEIGACLQTCEAEDPTNPFPCGSAASCIGGFCVPNSSFD